MPQRRPQHDHHNRFHWPHFHLHGAFGSDLFGSLSERFARFFGTPHFLIMQTLVVAIWIGANVLNYAHFDAYPFILLNLAFSTQAAYAAPLILLAQTRQADRDKAHADADARHREELATQAQTTAKLMLELLEQNTELTRKVNRLTQEIHQLLSQEKLG